MSAAGSHGPECASDDDLRLMVGALRALELGVFEYDAVHGRQRFCAACRRIWGLDPEDEPTPERITSMIHPEDRDVVRIARASLEPEGLGHFAVEHRIIRKDGAIRWVQVRARTVLSTDGGERRVLGSAGTMQDVTELRTSRHDRRAGETRHAFMVALEDRLRGLSAPKSMKFEASRMLAQALGVARVGYAEDAGDGQSLQVGQCYADGLEQLRGTLRYDSFGSDVRERFARGEPLLRRDVALDPRLGDEERSAYRRIGVAATVSVPLTKDGRPVAVLFVHAAGPRDWSAEEIALVEAVAHRTWEAVERARAERRVRQAQRVLRARSERLQLFIEHAPAAIAMLDRRMRYVAVSHRFADDYRLPREGLVGRSHYEVFPDLPERWRESNRRCLAGATERSDGEAFVRADGSVQWLKWELRPWRTPRGTIGGLLLFTEDITQRQEYETRLRESSARLRLAFEAAGMSPWRANLNADRFEASEHAVALHGLPMSAEAWTIRRASEVIHPDDRPRVLAALEKSARDGVSCQVEYRTVWPDGSVRWVANAARGELDARGQPTGRVHGTVREVTAAHEAMDRIAASEARLRMTLEAARAGAYDWDLDTGQVRWSPESFELFGMAPVPTVTVEEIFARVDPRDADALRERIRAAVAGREADFRAEYRISHPERGQRWILAVGQVQRGQRLAVRMRGLVLDVTAQKELEEALLRAHAQKDRFLATLSHELRNPLAPIRTAAQVLASPKLRPEQLVWAREVIQRQVGHLALLLDDLLDVARITQNKLVLRRERVALSAVVDASVETARPVLDRKSHDFIVALPSTEVHLEADPLRLSQVLSNLLTNAAKYTDPGGNVALRATVHGSELVLEVADDGIGFDPSAGERLFEMFSQAPSGTARAEGGLGIGLALVKGLVALHGGTVGARSAGPGQGSVFRVTLPLTAADAQESPPGAREARRSAGTRRVLVADDNRDAADSLAVLLRLNGHEVRVAYAGRPAVALAATFNPDVVFLDLGLPDLDGCEVARQVRAGPGGSRMRLVAVTGWGQDDDRRRTEAAGFDVHLTKPVDPEMLERVLQVAPDP
jgi:PAS domain S-box-containing protein